jgi:hypothetical protein
MSCLSVACCLSLRDSSSLAVRAWSRSGVFTRFHSHNSLVKIVVTRIWWRMNFMYSEKTLLKKKNINIWFLYSILLWWLFWTWEKYFAMIFLCNNYIDKLRSSVFWWGSRNTWVVGLFPRYVPLTQTLQPTLWIRCPT